MKRLWIALLILILVLGVNNAPGWASEIKDVDPSHWAYKSIKMLIDKGYISLYEDSTFRGDKSVSRYELAEVVARLLERLEEGTISADQIDVNTIRELTVEFRKELVDIIQKQNLFSSRLSQLEKNQVVIKEDIAHKQQQIEEIIDQLILLKELEHKLEKAEGELTALKKQITQVENDMAQGLSFSISDLNTQIKNLQAEDEANAKAIKALQEENAQLKEEIANLKEKNTEMLYYMIGGLLLSLLIR
ncbi:hypothetical protein BBF96_04015 [Anoxybacter fermentans]|uniref:SLH domain-containing protein n=1 Tax=Anoxybacter fermentans TaxID=1323375 RepID=A0A3Q9HPH8_9FIRM|nr:S-layer homology domain-containing protein [Anoxybacter fermentans]AZR72625.1 hypothetical protein BBF96_04015 [Anoxybacter fermentans]